MSEISWAGICFALTEKLRSEVPAIPLLEKTGPAAEDVKVPPHCLHGSSAFDRYISATSSTAEEYEYASGVLKLMCVERFAAGWVEILHFEIFVLKTVVAWVLVEFVLP